MAKKSKGRQKIEMTRMSKESNLLVTFSKRRSGLFKKASELCTLCGAEIAIVVFSPGKKAFSFGHPSVEVIADRFFYKNSVHGSSSSATSQLMEAHRNASVRELNLQLTEATNQLEMEKKRGDDFNNMRKNPNQERCWWEAPVDELAMEQLKELKLAMEELKKNVTKQAEKMGMLEHPNPHFANTNVQSFYGMGPNNTFNGPNDPIADMKVQGLGFSMTSHGHPPGYGFSYGYGHGHGQGHGQGQGQGQGRGFF